MQHVRYSDTERPWTGRPIERFESAGARAARIVEATQHATVTCLSIEPGGVIGTHPAVGAQLFLVVTGSGWVSGPDGTREPIAAGQGVLWDSDEIHASGSDTGMTALAIEGPALVVPPIHWA